MTDAEKKLWNRLRGNQVGVYFRRQAPIGPYIVDFLCMSARLVVEVDGSQHYSNSGRAYDATRDEYLKNERLTVLRFSNTEVLLNLEGVVQGVYEYIHSNHKSKRSRPFPPLPGEDEGGVIAEE